jgi:hypothetical protein
MKKMLSSKLKTNKPIWHGGAGMKSQHSGDRGKRIASSRPAWAI